MSTFIAPPLVGEFDAAAFGSRIKGLRTLRKLSLEEVASASGFTKSHVWELETGRSRNPSVRAVWSLARALGVTPAHLMGISPDGLSLHPTAMEVACIVDRALAQHPHAPPGVSEVVAPKEYRGWSISWDYGYFTATGPNYDASYEGEEDGWVDNGERCSARTWVDLKDEIDTFEAERGQCAVPPKGWWCSRPAGHEGPCAARPVTRDSGRLPQGEDPSGAECEASQSGARSAIAQPFEPASKDTPNAL